MVTGAWMERGAGLRTGYDLSILAVVKWSTYVDLGKLGRLEEVTLCPAPVS